MVYQTLLADLWIAIAQVMVALALGVLSVYTGVGLLDRFTERIDEWKEIRRGNAAVGILVLTIVFSIIWMVAPRIKEVVGILHGEGTAATLLILFLAGLLHLVITLVVAIFVVVLAIRLFDYMTMDIDENAELKKGNVAVALVLAALVFSIAWLMTDFIFQLVEKIDVIHWIESIAA